MQENQLPDLPLFVGELNGDVITLSKDETHHLAKVMRLKVGNEILVTNAKGKIAKAQISSIEKTICHLDLLKSYDFKTNNEPKITIGACLLKSNERFEFFLEKSTEIGVTTFQPIISNRCERRKYNENRYDKIVFSAAKQSLKRCFPKINTCEKFNDFVQKPFDGNKYIAHCHWDIESSFLYNLQPEKKDSIILIGPEGDFTKEELDFSIANGYKPIFLGSQRLRSETAGVVASNILKIALDKLQ